MHPYVHCSNIHGWQDTETTKMSSTEDWIKMMWYIYTTEHFSAIKKKKMLPFATAWMDLENIMLTENKTVRERQIPYHFTHMWNLMNKLN